MNDFFKRIMTRIRETWAKWKPLQKGVFFGIIGVVVLAIILLFVFSAGPNMVSVIQAPIKDSTVLDRIGAALDAENVRYQITADGRVNAYDDKSAKKAKAILAREDLIPAGTDPWAIFDTDRWTITDFERNVNLRRAIQDQIEQHIAALDDVDSAKVVIQIPEKQLFADNQDPVTASVILVPHPGSDIATNQKKIKGIEKLIMLGVPGLVKQENIIITDGSGVQLNDWTNLADVTKLDLKERELKIKRQTEARYRTDIENRLAKMFGDDRVNVINVDVTMDMGNTNGTKTEITPIVMHQHDNTNPADDPTSVLPNVPIMEKNYSENFKGSGWNPEGPAGTEGQTTPAYKDQSGLVGAYDRKDSTTNYEVNKTQTNFEGSPSIQRVSVAVGIDGTWTKVHKPDGSLDFNPDGSIKREYSPVAADDLKSAQKLVEAAVGFLATRNDLVSVQNVKFDRSKEQQAEDDEFRKAQQTQQVILFSLIGVAAILLIFIVFRLVSRELERRRRLREEELARQHQAMREAALRSAEEETSEVEMSVEERARMELQEHAINMAREQPENVAQLIRTWLMEE